MKLRIALASALAAVVAACSPTYAESPENSLCAGLYDFSYTTMQARQHGVSLKVAIASAPVAKTEQEKRIQKVLLAVVKDAYSVPLFKQEENKQIAATEFAANVYVSCIEITEPSVPVKQTIKEWI